MQTRLSRYAQFLQHEFHRGFLRSDEYSLRDVTDDLRARMLEGRFRRIVFTGMGCSAIVSEIVRGYFAEIGSDLDVYVVNDYDFTFLTPTSVLDDEATLFIISSYSGFSREPLHALNRLSDAGHRVLLLTSGGDLAAEGERLGVSVARWELQAPDREYPLFHVTQYFAILMRMFLELGLVAEDHLPEIEQLPAQLAADFTGREWGTADAIAQAGRDANTVMLASPRWHESLLKLAKMHFNEMAMVPATRNYFHEFCHSEVATLSDPERKHSIILFIDDEEDDYTAAKQKNLLALLTADLPQNKQVRVTEVRLDQLTFLRKYFTALAVLQQAVLKLGLYHDTASRDLISESAGNRWYHSTTIDAELASVAPAVPGRGLRRP